MPILATGRCFFCGKSAGENNSNIKVPMIDWKSVQSYRSDAAHITTEWNEREVIVNRCPKCKQLHGSCYKPGWIWGIVGFLVVIVGQARKLPDGRYTGKV